MARALNTAELAWEGASGNAVGETAGWLGSWDSLTGGNFLFGVEISNSPSALALGEVYFIAAQRLGVHTDRGKQRSGQCGTRLFARALRRRCRCHSHSVLRHAHRQPWHQRRQPIAGPCACGGAGQRTSRTKDLMVTSWLTDNKDEEARCLNLWLKNHWQWIT